MWMSRFVAILSNWTYFRVPIAPSEGPNYGNTYGRITLVEDPNPSRTKSQLERLHHLIQITNAAVLTELQHEHQTLRAMTFGLSYPRFLVDYHEAELRNSAFHRRPNVKDLK